jgi:NADPH:quinone reductase-like Zn-dependent oxidoreductase
MSAAESPQPGNALPTAPAVVRERPGGETTRAIVLEKFGGLDSLVYTDIPKPLPKDGEVVIKIRGFGSPGFPLSDVPLQDIAAQVAGGQLEAAPERVFSFNETREAHRVMEAGEAGGKMLVVVQ